MQDANIWKIFINKNVIPKNNAADLYFEKADIGGFAKKLEAYECFERENAGSGAIIAKFATVQKGGTFYMEPSKSDWKLYREKVAGWQERYMERLIKDYISYLISDEQASTKFWEMEKRIKQDKKTPGVCIELRKGNMIFDLVRFIQDGVIVFDELNDFSDELRENVKVLWERFK